MGNKMNTVFGENNLGVAAVQAAQSKGLKNVKLYPYFNLSCADTANTESTAQTMLDEVVGGARGGIIRSISFSFSPNFQSNYKFLIEIDGIDIRNSVYQYPDSTDTSFDYVVDATKGYEIAPNARVRIFAYNANGATTAGTFSVYIVVSD